MKKRVLIITAIILLVLIATFGASVALFSKALNGEKTTSVKVGDLTFKYTEITGIGNGINININGTDNTYSFTSGTISGNTPNNSNR